MPGSQSNQNDFKLGQKETLNIVYTLAKSHSLCFLPFMRKNFGSEALGLPGVIAFVIILAAGSFGRIPEMGHFLVIWLGVMLAQRASTMRAKRRGVVRHSRYDGDVDTTWIKSRKTVKQVLEPLLCVVAGICIEGAGLSHEMAVFVGSGAFSLALVALIDGQLGEKRVQAMRDAEIEQHYFAAKYRGEVD